MTMIRPALAVALLLACATARAWPALDPAAGPQPAGSTPTCFNLSSVPLNTNLDFDTEVQPVFDNWCVGCHNNGDMSGDLSLEAGASLELLVEVSASGAGGQYTRVIPGDPRGSALFNKVNCDPPFFANPMPLGGTLPLIEQAILYDWIYEGAKPSELSDWLFRNSFDSERI